MEMLWHELMLLFPWAFWGLILFSNTRKTNTMAWVAVADPTLKQTVFLKTYIYNGIYLDPETCSAPKLQGFVQRITAVQLDNQSSGFAYAGVYKSSHLKYFWMAVIGALQDPRIQFIYSNSGGNQLDNVINNSRNRYISTSEMQANSSRGVRDSRMIQVWVGQNYNKGLANLYTCKRTLKFG